MAVGAGKNDGQRGITVSDKLMGKALRNDEAVTGLNPQRLLPGDQYF